MESLIGISVFLICGISFSIAGIYLLINNRRIEKNGTKTRAKIIGYSKEKVEFSDEMRTVFFPIFEFKDRNGIVVKQKHDSGEQTEIKEEFVEIYYLKNDNEYEILINTDSWKSYFPIGFIVFGIIFLTIGILITLKINTIIT